MCRCRFQLSDSGCASVARYKEDAVSKLEQICRCASITSRLKTEFTAHRTSETEGHASFPPASRPIVVVKLGSTNIQQGRAVLHSHNYLWLGLECPSSAGAAWGAAAACRYLQKRTADVEAYCKPLARASDSTIPSRNHRRRRLSSRAGEARSALASRLRSRSRRLLFLLLPRSAFSSTFSASALPPRRRSTLPPPRLRSRKPPSSSCRRPPRSRLSPRRSRLLPRRLSPRRPSRRSSGLPPRCGVAKVLSGLRRCSGGWLRSLRSDGGGGSRCGGGGSFSPSSLLELRQNRCNVSFGTAVCDVPAHHKAARAHNAEVSEFEAPPCLPDVANLQANGIHTFSVNDEAGDIGVHARLSLLSEEDESESLLLPSDEEPSLLLESESEELLESESDELLLLAAAAAAACCCMMSFGRFCTAGSRKEVRREQVQDIDHSCQLQNTTGNICDRRCGRAATALAPGAGVAEPTPGHGKSCHRRAQGL